MPRASKYYRYEVQYRNADGRRRTYVLRARTIDEAASRVELRLGHRRYAIRTFEEPIVAKRVET